MLSIKALSILALAAGTAFAVPTPAEEGSLVERQWWGGRGSWSDSNMWHTATDATPTATETPTAAAEPKNTWSSAPAASPATSPSSTPSSGDTGYMAIVSKWRTAGGLPDLSHDSQLEANALKTSTNSVGGLIHELNPGTMAQVLAPGNPNNFENVYVGGWLCEIPTLPGLNGICATEAQGWDHSNGETGHALILTSLSYTKIGCAISSATNVWACDLA